MWGIAWVVKKYIDISSLMEKNVALSDKIQTVKKILNFKEKILGGKGTD